MLHDTAKGGELPFAVVIRASIQLLVVPRTIEVLTEMSQLVELRVTKVAFVCISIPREFGRDVRVERGVEGILDKSRWIGDDVVSIEGSSEYVNLLVIKARYAGAVVEVHSHMGWSSKDHSTTFHGTSDLLLFRCMDGTSQVLRNRH